MLFSDAVIAIVVFFICVYALTVWLDATGYEDTPIFGTRLPEHSKYRVRIILTVGGVENSSFGYPYEYKTLYVASNAARNMEKALSCVADCGGVESYCVELQVCSDGQVWETISVDG